MRAYSKLPSGVSRKPGSHASTSGTSRGGEVEGAGSARYMRKIASDIEANVGLRFASQDGALSRIASKVLTGGHRGLPRRLKVLPLS